MDKKFLNPETLLKPRGFTQVVTVAGAAKMIFVSGQVAVDKDGKLVGAGDLAAQARQAATNLKLALEAAGATASDIIKLNAYIVNYKPSDYAAFREARNALAAEGEPPASTLVGVTALAFDGLMIEIEATAMVEMAK
jgi:enamine deaminase RidA (YjgF/YER057c/UK114 family)